MAKITRKQLATYINATPSSTATYQLLGTDIEEMNVDMNFEVESKTNILGESSISITNGTRTSTVEPYIADSGTDLHTFLQDIIDNRKELDDLITDIVEVKKWESPTGDSYPAIKKQVKIEITSYGGDDEGYKIPFNLHFTGTDTAGTFDVALETFTAS
jgi:hypothetical protein